VSDENVAAQRAARREARRGALEKLAGSVRKLIEASVSSNVEPQEVLSIEAAIEALADRLNLQRHPGPYSGLLGRDPIDRTRPNRSVPLSPWAGRFNPLAPPIEIRFENGEVFGQTTLGKPYIGPPGVAHGGVVAGIMDQLLASAGQSAHVPGVTANMTVHFRRPTPLFEELRLHAWADPRDDGSKKRKVHAEIRHRGVVTAEAEALVIRSDRLSGGRPGR